MKEINIENWNRKTQYNWFKSFINPTYGIDVKIDVTEIVKITKNRNESFFINFLYILTMAMNESDAMRTRYINGKVFVFDDINPTYTVLKADNNFVNAKHLNSKDYHEFYARAKKAVEDAKNGEIANTSYNEPIYNEYYMTCLPWLNYVSMTHPVPSGNLESLSVPRVCWGKYEENNNAFTLTLNITVNHMLVDGKDLSDTFLNIQKKCQNAAYLLQ